MNDWRDLSCFQRVWHVWLAVEVCWRASSENCSAFEILSSVVWCEPFIQYTLCIHYNISSRDWPPARAFPLQARQTRRWEEPWICTCRGPWEGARVTVSSWGLGSSFIGGHDKYIHVWCCFVFISWCQRWPLTGMRGLSFVNNTCHCNLLAAENIELRYSSLYANMYVRFNIINVVM